MTKEDILAQIEIVLPKLETYMKHKEVSLDSSERDILSRIAKAIIPGSNYNFNCSPCGGELMTIVYSYYQRESKGLN